MRAIRQDAFGGPEVFKVVEVADPVALPTQFSPTPNQDMHTGAPALRSMS